jgi:D-cysteine desulfhydrase
MSHQDTKAPKRKFFINNHWCLGVLVAKKNRNMKMIPLFEQFPALKAKLPYVSLCELPTPIQKLNRMGEKMGLDQLYVKRDDLTGKIYGGNKVRKLEFILGDALRKGAKETLTFGFAGSNHALATAVYAKHLGLKSISMLLPQHNAHYVRRNLLMSQYCEVELHQHSNKGLLSLAVMVQLLRHRLKKGSVPYFIPPGGSSSLGITGFVNAAFELKSQVERKEIPEPDLIYVGLGTAGTVVGLMIGLKALKMKTRVIPIRVIDKKFIDKTMVIKRYSEANSFLHSMNPSFPKLELSADDFEIRDEYLGSGYAQFTKQGIEAINLMKETEGIKLDGTYTGKTFAALIDDAHKPKHNLKDKVVLFWNTLNSRDFSDSIQNIDYHQLPGTFHQYFEKEVQPLDRR